MADNYSRILYDFDSDGNPVYVGKHTNQNVSTADPYWRIWHFTWDSSGNPTSKAGPATGSWDDRATLIY